METFATYIMEEKDWVKKLEIAYYLRKKANTFFNNTVIFKTVLAKLFLDHTEIDLDKNLILTACILCNCKKVDNFSDMEKIKTYAKEGAEYLEQLGFDKRFCKICEEVNRYSGSEPREPESDILELVDNFGGMMLDRPERAGFTPEKAIMQLELETFKAHKNRYFEQFKEFVTMMQEVEV